MVSVVLVVYNSEKYLSEAVDSVFAQTYKDFELIAIDDGSTDQTLKILQNYERYPNFKLIPREHTKNLGGNRNFAIKMAKGDIIAFIDGDDIWEPEKLEKQLEYINHYDMVCTDAYVINENGDVTSDQYISSFGSDFDFDLSTMIVNNDVVVSSVIIKKQAVIDSGYFEDGPDTRAEDYVLWLNYLQTDNKIKFIKLPLLRYRLHSENWSYISYQGREKLLHRTLELRSALGLKYGDRLKKYSRLGCSFSYAELTKLSFKNGKYSDSKNYCVNFLKNCDDKFSVKYLKFFAFRLMISVIALFKKNPVTVES